MPDVGGLKSTKMCQHLLPVNSTGKVPARVFVPRHKGTGLSFVTLWMRKQIEIHSCKLKPAISGS